jgi:hypothetical protein
MVISHNGQTIEIRVSSLTGKETVLYNGNEVSSKFSVMGTVHIFRTIESKEDVQYEVEIGSRWHGMSHWTIVRRNWQIIYTDK